MPVRCPLCADSDSRTVEGRTPGILAEEDVILDGVSGGDERLPQRGLLPHDEVISGMAAAEMTNQEDYKELVATLEPRPPLPLPPSNPEQETQAGGEEDALYWITPEAALALVLEDLVQSTSPAQRYRAAALLGGKDLRGGSTQKDFQVLMPKV